MMKTESENYGHQGIALNTATGGRAALHPLTRRVAVPERHEDTH